MFHLPVSPAFQINNLTITLQTSDFFAPYAAVTIQSIIDNASLEYNYDILITAWDMKDSTERRIVSLADGQENVSIRVVDVSREIKPYRDFAKKRRDYERFSATGVVRLALPWLLKDYDVVLNLDCDTLVRVDVSELFRYNLDEYCMGGVPDMIYYTVVNFDPKEEKYITDKVFNKLKLDKLSDYLNAGLLLLNLKKIRAEYTQEHIVNYAIDGDNFYRCYEQDTFNGLFKEKKLVLPPEWNWFVDGDTCIELGEQGWSPNDEFLERYHKAEKTVKNYHYVGIAKPWLNAVVDCSRVWWTSARRTPFLDVLLARTETYMTMDHEHKDKAAGEKRMLFYCETPYELLTAANIKYHYYPHIPADLLLSATAELLSLKERIEKADIFQNVCYSDYDADIAHGRLPKKLCKQKMIGKREKELGITPQACQFTSQLENTYTDYFLAAVESHYGVMTFYYLANLSGSPAVHIFDNGITSYMDDIFPITDGISWSRKQRPGRRFAAHVRNTFLYYPEFYTAPNGVPAVPVPQLDDLEPEFTALLDGIFGRYTLPEQKYLFLDECFVDEGLAANDIELLDAVGDAVGKENIAVLLHPRSDKKAPLYRLHGYEVYPIGKTPWQTAFLDPEAPEKIVLTVSSESMLDPLLAAGRALRVVSLANAMKISRRAYACAPAYYWFLDRVRKKVNEEENVLNTPCSLREIKDAICYIEGVT